MKYLACLIAFFFLSFGLITLLSSRKANRIIHILGYLFPFWLWGLIFVVFSAFFWYFQDKFYGITAIIFSSFLLLKGLFMIFYPKRKIKKIIEKWKNLPNEIKKIQGVILIIISFLIFTAINYSQ